MHCVRVKQGRNTRVADVTARAVIYGLDEVTPQQVPRGPGAWEGTKT